MAFVFLRQMHDHAAEYGYGVPAFNVNNLEQIQAIMEAAQATDARSSCRGLGRGAQVCGRNLLAPHDAGGGGIASRHSRGAAPGPRHFARRVHVVQGRVNGCHGGSLPLSTSVFLMSSGVRNDLMNYEMRQHATDNFHGRLM